MKRLLPLLLSLALLAGCAAPAAAEPTPLWEFTDDEGYAVSVTSLERVAVLYGSFAEIFLLAGGTVGAVTSDALTERQLDLPEGTLSVGTVKAPDREALLAYDPTLVICSADIAAQEPLAEFLRGLGIPTARMRVDSFADYLRFLRLCCDMTGRDDLYEQNGAAVERRIGELLASVPAEGAPTALLLRSYGSGVRVKSDDNFTGRMLSELGVRDLAKESPSLLEELSLEQLMALDPDYLFVVVMGDEEAGLRSLWEGVGANEGFRTLSAVKNDRLVVLPRELFHYKPNARWAESYEYLIRILYPEVLP